MNRAGERWPPKSPLKTWPPLQPESWSTYHVIHVTCIKRPRWLGAGRGRLGPGWKLAQVCGKGHTSRP